MRPEQQVKGDLKSAAVEDHLIPQRHTDQRKDQISYVGIGEGSPVDRIQVPDFLEKLGEHNAEEHRDRRSDCGEQESLHAVGSQLDLKGAEDHAGLDHKQQKG